MGMVKYGTPDICPQCGGHFHHDLIKSSDGQLVTHAECDQCKYAVDVKSIQVTKGHFPSAPESDSPKKA